ncbi:MAG: fibronectin type III domain-containing protein [Deltaproteobacteria bacterium]|nr:MAG: fibronectin type III domain-containing protein [Deltaproteobacteria bacterium]
MSPWNNGIGFIQDPSSSCDYTISYTDKMIWDSVGKKLYFLGQSHCSSSYQQLAIYDEVTNGWTISSTSQSFWAAIGGPSHSYNHLAGPRNGKLYYKFYSSPTIYAYNTATGIWNTTDVPAIPAGNMNCCGQLDYFPERDSLVWVDGDWGIWEYTFSNNTWTNTHQTTVGNVHPMGDYENVGRYNSVRRAIFFGGGVVSGPGIAGRAYELTQGNTVTTLSNMPANYFLANSGVTSSGVLSVDPSGQYIAFMVNNVTGVPAVFTLDASNPANPWVQQPSGGNPPWFTGRTDGPVFGVAAATIPEYGVMAFLANNTNASKLYLFKFQAAAPDTVPPSNPTNLAGTSPNPTTTNLTWTASGDNVGVTGYDVYRCSGTCTPSVQIGTSGIPSFSNTGLSAAQTFSYSVKARDAANNVSGFSNVVTVTSASGDAIAPSVPTSLNAAVISSTQVNLTWTASTDNVAVTGYEVFQCGGSMCVPASLIASPGTNSYNVTTGLSAGLTYTWGIKAFDAAGNRSALSATATATTTAGSTSNFAQRCAAPGVLRCFGFDSTADLGGLFGDNFGYFNNSLHDGGGNYTHTGCNGTADTQCPTLDNTIAASGNSSLKFVIPTNSNAGASGQWFANFTSDLSVQLGQNSDFYIQWRQRFSTVYLNTFYQPGAGWKLIDIATGDFPGCTPATSNQVFGLCPTSCIANDVVVQNTFLRGFAQMYNSCTGSTSHVAYEPIQEGGDFGNGFDYKIQNARPSPFCLYSQGNTNPKLIFHRRAIAFLWSPMNG